MTYDSYQGFNMFLWSTPSYQNALRDWCGMRGLTMHETVVAEERKTWRSIRFTFIDPADEVRHGHDLAQFMWDRLCRNTP